MPQTKPEKLDLTYPLRTAARLTGVSPELLRAWERRYRVVTPTRTPGGTRRYSAEDLERLRLVKAAVDAGHRIGQIADLPNAELKQRCAALATPPAHGGVEAVIDAAERLDAAEAQRQLSVQLSTLGPVRFAREFARPLVVEIGERWANDRLGISAEHLATGVLRSMLGAALQPDAIALAGPRIVFATPSGERHELGLLMAALTAMGSGANPIYLGVEVPVEDLIAAVERSGAAALALSVVTLPAEKAERSLAAVRGGLPDNVRVWIGGAGASSVAAPPEVDLIDDFAALEQHVALLGAASH